MNDNTSSRTRSATSTRANAAARWLRGRYLARGAFGPFPAECAPRDVSEAYSAAQLLVRLKAQDCGPVCGWKIALSNPAMQAFCGLPEPIAGAVHTRQVVASPARVRAADYVRLLIEFEIALELGANLPARKQGYTREQVANAVSAVRPAFEIADDLGADYKTLSQHGLQLVADNAWNQGAVLGERRTDWRNLDLAALRGVVQIDDEIVGEGFGRDQMGHPLDAMTWLANNLSRRGIGMRAGDFAILGSLVTSKFPVSGQTLRFSLDGFEPLQLSVD
jgi:2-keto-4-pentenoate hydratase